jgi:hypothetical protein
VTPVCTIRISPNGERVMRGRGYAEAVPPPPLPDSVFTKRPIFAVDPNLRESAVSEALRAASFGCPWSRWTVSGTPTSAGPRTLCRRRARA